MAGIKIESSSTNPTRDLIRIWCRTTDVSVLNLIEAIQALDRYDIIDDIEDLLIEDCQLAINQGVVQLREEDTKDALTLQDLEANRKGHPLPKYHAMVLYGNSLEDEAFAEHIIDRMEMSGLKVIAN